MVAADRRAGRPVGQRTGLDRGQPWCCPACGRCTARQALDPFGVKDRPDRLRDTGVPASVNSAAISSTERSKARSSSTRLCTRSALRADLGPAWRNGSTARCRCAARCHLMHAGRRVAEPVATSLPRARRRSTRASPRSDAAPVRRLKEIRRSGPHTSTDLPEQHRHKVASLSDAIARRVPLTASDRLESARL